MTITTSLRGHTSTIVEAHPGTRPGRTPGRPLAARLHGYDVHGLVQIQSAVRLPDLGSFAVGALLLPDLTIDVGVVGGRRPRLRSRCEQGDGSLLYRGRLGGGVANFAVDTGDERIRVMVSPWLARRPDVVFRGIVEPLLRFLLVSKGYVLVPAAALSAGGHTVLIVSQDDDLVTMAVLDLLGSSADAVFLAGDRTILDEHGNAFSYPTPLTLTAASLPAARHVLRADERLLAQLQRRLQPGRRRRRRASLPSVFLTAARHSLAPPPRFAVDRLAACGFAPSAPLDEVLVVAGGLSEVDPAALAAELAQRSDRPAAGGFPLLPASVVVDGEGYQALRSRERAIVASSLQQVGVRRISWGGATTGGPLRHWLPSLPAAAPAGSRVVVA